MTTTHATQYGNVCFDWQGRLAGHAAPLAADDRQSIERQVIDKALWQMQHDPFCTDGNAYHFRLELEDAFESVAPCNFAVVMLISEEGARI